MCDGSKAKVEWMKKILVVNGYIGLDLRNENSTNDSDILFYKNFKLRFWILRTKENLSERVTGSEAIKITAMDAVQQFKNLLDNK